MSEATLPRSASSDADLANPPVGTVPLSELQENQQATVAWVEAGHPYAARFRDLGFVPGSQLVTRIKAPFRGPIEFEVRGSRFCLRLEDAKSIYVHV